MDWQKYTGFDGSKRAYGYYIVNMPNKPYLILSDENTPKDFGHLYNKLKIDKSVFPRVSAIHQTRMSNSLPIVVQLVTTRIKTYYAHHYHFTFNVYRLKHLANEYHMDIVRKFTSVKIGGHYYDIHTGYTLTKGFKNICDVDGLCGYRPYKYPYKIMKTVYHSQWWRLMHPFTIDKGCREYVKTVPRRYKIPKPLQPILRKWSKDMAAYLICQDPLL